MQGACARFFSPCRYNYDGQAALLVVRPRVLVGDNEQKAARVAATFRGNPCYAAAEVSSFPQIGNSQHKYFAAGLT
jgi:hypothetical protein